MKKINFDSIINSIIFFYILSLYLFTYRTQLNYVSNALALIFIVLVGFKILILRPKIIINKFLLFHLLFIGSCLVSAIYAINKNIAISKVYSLVLLWVLMAAFINYIDSIVKLKKVMKYFIYSGFIASIYILQNSDFTQLTRFGGELGNVNAVGMIIGISSVFTFYFIQEEKKYWYLPLLIANLFVIIMTGSRKSLLFVVLSIIVVLISKKESGFQGRFKMIFRTLIFLFVVFYLIYNIPIFYEVIGKRMDNFLDFAFGDGTLEGSINIRTHMIESGWDWFKQKPVTGYGIDNYRILYGSLTGLYTYSHNNVIELLVGIGIFGSMIFYLSYIFVIKDLIMTSKNHLKSLCYTYMAIIFGYVFMSVGLVSYYDKHIGIILALGSIIAKMSKSEERLYEAKIYEGKII